RRSFVIDVERAAAARERSIIDDGACGRCDALPDAIGEGRGALAIEIALEPVPDRLVQQHSGPARTEHDGHEARRCWDRLEVDERLPDRLTPERERTVLSDELIEREATAAARITLLT